jgi:hypothetical protein
MDHPNFNAADFDIHYVERWLDSDSVAAEA